MKTGQPVRTGSGPGPARVPDAPDRDRRRNRWLLPSVFLVLFLADQLTKAWVTGSMDLHESFPVVPDLFSITYVRNPGAAFGFLAGASPLFRQVFFVAVTLLAIGLILYSLASDRFVHPSWKIPLTLILSGAAGNLVDRVRFGEVVDFLDVYIGSHHWPAFNVADSAITVGAVLLVILAFRGDRDAPEADGQKEGRG